jgi:large subunit ribosomal protein L17
MMRHRNSFRQLSMDSSQRGALLRNMVTALLRHGQIRTTAPRAKELRRYVDHVITMGRNAPSEAQIAALEGAAAQAARARRVHVARQVRLWVNDPDVVKLVFGEYATRFASRPGGYTRVIRAGKRPGDNADMAVIQLVEALAAPADAAAE